MKLQKVRIMVIRKIFIGLILASISISGFSQVIIERSTLPAPIADSLRKGGIVFNEQKKKPEILLSTTQAVRFLQRRLLPQYWKNTRDPLRIAMGQLVYEASHQPFDSSVFYLKKYPFDSLDVAWDKFYIWEPLKLKIPVISYPEHPVPVDTLAVADTNRPSAVSDSNKVSVLKIPMQVSRSKPVAGLKDTTILVVVDTLHEVSSDYNKFPFTYYEYPFQSDSIWSAVNLLLNYMEMRDSSIVNITGLGDVVTPIWLNSRSGQMKRFWLKNDLNDSITVWIGASSKNTLGVYLEQGVNFRRPVRQGDYSEAKIEVKEIDKSKLLNVNKIIVKPLYWKYRSETSFALNQASLTNWVKGGESSISIALDMTGYADYNNKALKITSNNFARLKYGLIASGENGVRKNLDLLETNSKLNHKAFGKFDFSAILLFKTQVSKGFNYTKVKVNGLERDTAILVSRIMNPAIITVGIGLDYKPNKNTSINFSPFSYKGTFVHDTARIDQTKYGIAADRRSKNEPGASFMITNEYKPYKTVTVINRLQLFTNYINKPQNIDVDWEMILTANLNWFTDVRFNTHLIFDDDTKTAVLDKDKNPVLVGGIPKKTARVQFKEVLGFSFIFRF
jgi:hypothetical protein